ncbi:VWA domain-containing protein [Actinomyces bowdenii]|uniref:VWA domain-containing protein n=1 Tax=Actinomyces bowdenii TaxID=131109 RepID=A0A3P1V9D6_9ACTO|nr:VWA domain-containing protein [Actinomyces bowdenii]RRD30751.1 VWA domain-containing protein [Actinomyces bowdenii]
MSPSTLFTVGSLSHRRLRPLVLGLVLLAAMACMLFGLLPAHAAGSAALPAPGRPPAPGSAARAAPAAPAPAAAPGAVEDFGSCMAGKGGGALVILMDQSGSLRSTDPQDSRVQAGHYLAQRLAAFADSSGIELSIRVAGFAADYQGAGQWTALGDDTLPAVEQQITSVGQSLTDYDTDYWNALEGARQDLVDHDTSGCRAVAWLSDGAHDLDVRDSSQARERHGERKVYAPEASLAQESGVEQAEAAGIQDLCRPTGMVDQLRSSGVRLLGIGLSDGSTDFSFMQRITTGGGTAPSGSGMEPCGDLASPPGAFYPVSDIDSLLLAFDSISTPGTTVTGRSVSICQGSVCAEGETSFVLDRSLSTVHLLASSQVEGLEAHLYPPGGQAPIVMASTGTGARSEAGVAYEWLTPRTLQADLDAKAISSWDGQWRLVLVDTASTSSGEEARVNLHLSSPLTLSWKDLGSASLRQGEAVTGVDLSVTDGAGGQEVPSDRLTGSLAMSAVLTDAKGTDHVLLETSDPAVLRDAQDITIPQDAALGSATLTTSLTVTTAPATGADGQQVQGTTLSPTVSSAPVTISPPTDYPGLGASVDFGRMEGSTRAQAELEVTGPGCVWLEDGAQQLTGAPAAAGSITVSAKASSSQDCVRVPEGRSATLPLTLSTQDHANGAVSGTLSVSVAPDGEPQRAQTIEVPFSAEMRRPLDAATAWTAFIIALVTGITLPVGLLYLFKYLSARIPAGPLISATAAVTLPQDGSQPTIDLPSQRLKMRSVPRGSREVAIGPYRLRARMGALPTDMPRVELAAPGAVSVSGATPGSRDGRAVLPLSLRGNWVAVLDRPDSPREATLIIMAASMEDAVVARIVDDARQRLAARVSSVAQTGGDSPRGPSSGGAEPATAGAALGSAVCDPGGSLPPLGQQPAGAGATAFTGADASWAGPQAEQAPHALPELDEPWDPLSGASAAVPDDGSGGGPADGGAADRDDPPAALPLL